MNRQFPGKAAPVLRRGFVQGTGFSAVTVMRSAPGPLPVFLPMSSIHTTWRPLISSGGRPYAREPDCHPVIMEKSGVDIGEIQALVPLERGTSGRISLLRAVGVAKERGVREGTGNKEGAVRVAPEEFGIRGGLSGPGRGMCSREQEVRAAALAGKHTEFEKILLRGAGWGTRCGACARSGQP